MRAWQRTVIFCALCFLTACSGIDLSILNTVTPTPPNTPTPTPTPVPPSEPPVVRPWNIGVLKAICLEQSYTGDLPASFKGGEDQSPESYILRVLNGINIRIQPPGSPCEATLTVQLDGKALSENYSGFGDLYTGGILTGFASLTAPGQKDLIFPIEGQEYPPVQISLLNDSEGPTSPEDYSFWDLYYPPLLDALNQIWGSQAIFWAGNEDAAAKDWQDPILLRAIYLEALSDAHGEGFRAVRALYETEFKNNPQTLPYLIDLLYADGKTDYFREVVVQGIYSQIDLHEPAVAKALLDCALRERHPNCRWYIQKRFGIAWDTTPEGLQKWFDKKFP